jgi:hypothetical protein
MAVRRYRKQAPWGGRVRDHSGRRIDADLRTPSQRKAAETARLAELDAIEPLPNNHQCGTADCYCLHAGSCCGCLPF